MTVCDRAGVTASVTPEHGPVAAGPRVCCEILPVACAAERILYLCRATGECDSPAWWVNPAPDLHPTQAVMDVLVHELRAAFDLSTSIVHSTSWRYDIRRGTLVLSFLVVLQPLAAHTGWPPQFALTPISPAVPTGQSPPPAQPIRVADVLVHGLRHFAMLRLTDRAIAKALSPEWHQVLARWAPLPAGLLDHYDPRSASPLVAPAARPSSAEPDPADDATAQTGPSIATNSQEHFPC